MLICFQWDVPLCPPLVLSVPFNPERHFTAGDFKPLRQTSNSKNITLQFLTVIELQLWSSYKNSFMVAVTATWGSELQGCVLGRLRTSAVLKHSPPRSSLILFSLVCFRKNFYYFPTHSEVTYSCWQSEGMKGQVSEVQLFALMWYDQLFSCWVRD